MSDFTPQHPMPPTTRTSTMAIISLIAGIAGLTVLPGVASLVAVITGHLAKNEIKKSVEPLTGGGLATGGLVTGYLGLAIGLCICLFFILMWAGLFTLPFLSSGYSY